MNILTFFLFHSLLFIDICHSYYVTIHLQRKVSLKAVELVEPQILTNIALSDANIIASTLNKAFNSGLAGAYAASIQVSSLMWLRYGSFNRIVVFSHRLQ